MNRASAKSRTKDYIPGVSSSETEKSPEPRKSSDSKTGSTGSHPSSVAETVTKMLSKQLSEELEARGVPTTDVKALKVEDKRRLLIAMMEQE
jgi:hypothetical protein